MRTDVVKCWGCMGTRPARGVCSTCESRRDLAAEREQAKQASEVPVTSAVSARMADVSKSPGKLVFGDRLDREFFSRTNDYHPDSGLPDRVFGAESYETTAAPHKRLQNLYSGDPTEWRPQDAPTVCDLPVSVEEPSLSTKANAVAAYLLSKHLSAETRWEPVGIDCHYMTSHVQWKFRIPGHDRYADVNIAKELVERMTAREIYHMVRSELAEHDLSEEP